MDVTRKTLRRARALRGAMSLPEVLLWQELRRLALEDLRFRRQHPFGPYILDFYCAEARLAVEVDGESHNVADRPERDARRDAWLERRGVRVLRLPATVVLRDMDSALLTILASSRQPPSSAAPTLPPEGEDL